MAHARLVMKKSCTALRKLGSAWISLDPFGVSLDQLRISQPQVVMKEALHSFPQARTQSHSFEIQWRALQRFTELCGCRTCMRAKNSFADPHSNRLLHTSRTLDRNCVLHGVVFTILIKRFKLKSSRFKPMISEGGSVSDLSFSIFSQILDSKSA